MPAGQRAPDLITDGCEPPCGCWELNSGPLEEQSVLLTAEPSLQPFYSVFKDVSLWRDTFKQTQASSLVQCIKKEGKEDLGGVRDYHRPREADVN